MKSNSRGSSLLSVVFSFLLWFSIWFGVGWWIGLTFDGHFWIIIPVQCGLHGFVAGIIFTIFAARDRRNIGGISPGRGAIYGAIAGIVPLIAVRLLTWFSLYIPLFVIPIDALFGCVLSLLLFRGSPQEPANVQREL